MPLHRYESPNGQGLCTYTSAGKVCGEKATYVTHLKSGEKIVTHPFNDKGLSYCAYVYEGGAVCNRSADWPVHQPKTGCGVEGALAAGRQAMEAMKLPDPVRAYLDKNASAAYETYHGTVFPVDDPPTTAQVVAMFHDLGLRLAVAKNQAYADAWREQGYIGNIARVLSKASRLRAMAWGEQLADEGTAGASEATGETLRDTLLDMANLCAFAAHNLDQGNRWGKP